MWQMCAKMQPVKFVCTDYKTDSDIKLIIFKMM